MANRILADVTVDDLKSDFSYNPETGFFTRLKTRRKWKAGEIAGGSDDKGYIKISIGGTQYFAHRLAWLFVHGVWPSLFIDHINRIKSDNRIQNLREVDKSGNGINRGELSNNVSGKSGVHWLRKNECWVAYATRRGNRIHLGSFLDKFDAICARKAWESKNPIEAIGELTR